MSRTGEDGQDKVGGRRTTCTEGGGDGSSENIERVEEISGSGGIFFSVKPPSDVACRPLI